MIRTRWLNALIVGATILVWLTLIGIVLAGVGVAVTLDGFDSFGVSDAQYTDPNGKECNPLDAVMNRVEGEDVLFCP